MKVKHYVKINYAAMNLANDISDKALPRATRRIVDIGVRAAKTSSKAQRKSGGPSAIVSSFTDRVIDISGKKSVGVVQVGGPSAGYVVWVNFGHTLRDGKWWDGYHFMEDGVSKHGGSSPGARSAMLDVANDIIREEINKEIKF